MQERSSRILQSKIDCIFGMDLLFLVTKLQFGNCPPEVTEDSAAERAGLQVNDVITSFDGKDVDSWETLVNLMKYYQVGEQVEVVYSRLENGAFTEYTTTLTLTEKPQVSNK